MGESKYYLHIYYIYYYIVLYINKLYIIIYIIIKNIIIHNNSFSHSLPPIGEHKKNCNLYTLYTFHSSLPRGGVQKKNCNLYTLYTFSRMFNPQQFGCFGWLTISLSLLRSLVIGRQSLRLRNKVEQVIGQPEGATLA